MPSRSCPEALCEHSVEILSRASLAAEPSMLSTSGLHPARTRQMLGNGALEHPAAGRLSSCAEMQAEGPALLSSVVFGSPGRTGCLERVGTGHSYPKQQQLSSRQTPILPQPDIRCWCLCKSRASAVLKPFQNSEGSRGSTASLQSMRCYQELISASPGQAINDREITGCGVVCCGM